MIHSRFVTKVLISMSKAHLSSSLKSSLFQSTCVIFSISNKLHFIGTDFTSNNSIANKSSFYNTTNGKRRLIGYNIFSTSARGIFRESTGFVFESGGPRVDVLDRAASLLLI